MTLELDTSGDPLALAAEQQGPQETSSHHSVAKLACIRRCICSLRRLHAIGDEIPPYSPCFELYFFLTKGISLGLAAFLNWGIPPLLAMIFAGQTQGSAHLQASLGYGRVWFNCTVLMPTFGLLGYISNVLPGCIGAEREDRIPRYLQRSVLLTFMLMLPMYMLQFAAGGIMYRLGVPWDNAADVRDYCRMMLVTAVLIAVSSHLESVCVNLGYTKCATFNSFITGLGVDVACTYFFIFSWGWGIHGAALAQIVVQLSRTLVWVAMIYYFGLSRKIFVVLVGGEALLSKTELREFIVLGIPQILGSFSGWLIFEFQLMALTNISGITKDARAAGAIWVQIESSLASAQDGWIRSTSMRTINLLGKQDPGAQKAFALFNALALAAVGLTNVPFFLYQAQLASYVSNDRLVQVWLHRLLWVLAIHTLTRIAFINSNMLFVPMGRGMLGTFITFVSFYCIAAPLACTVALTDVWTSAVQPKMVACVGATSVAQFVGLCASFLWLSRLDWIEAGAIINRRANMDRPGDIALEQLNAAEEVRENACSIC